MSEPANREADSLAALAQLVEELEALSRGERPLELYVRNVAPERLADGSWRTGYPDYQPAMDNLWAVLHEAGLGAVTPQDYNAWLAKGEPPLERLEQVEALDREELLLRLFVIRRHERFSDGHWSRMLEQGVLHAFASRLLALNRRSAGASPPRPDR